MQAAPETDRWAFCAGKRLTHSGYAFFAAEVSIRYDAVPAVV
jgi:hypothetical protein